MKIIIKTLQGKQLPLDVEETFTIRQTKEKIEEEHKMAADSQKLIAYGKVLEDDNKSLKEYNIKEGDFLVVMVSKPKPAAKPQSEPQPTVPAQQPAQSQPVQQPAPTVAAQQPPVAQPSTSAAGGAPQMTAEMEATITNLIGMTGRSQEDCILALGMARGIPDVAFDILSSGLPLNQLAAAAGGGQDLGDDYGDEEMEDEGGVGAGAGAGVGAQGMNAFQALASNPNFPLIRERIIQDPNFYNQFMQQLQTQQPQLYALIQSNPAAFMNLILGGDPNMGLAQPRGGAGPGARNPPGTISVTAEEMEAINRLTQLGFSKQRAAEAYFSCDKNEELAANFLFEAGAEDDETALQRTLAESMQQQPGASGSGAGASGSGAGGASGSGSGAGGASGSGSGSGSGAGQQPPGGDGGDKPDDDGSSLA